MTLILKSFSFLPRKKFAMSLVSIWMGEKMVFYLFGL